MRFTNRQKRILIRLATPVLAVLYQAYRVASLEAFRRRRAGGDLPNRILIVRLDTIGDVLLSEPAIRALRQSFLEARIDVLAGATGKAVLSGNPCIDRFIVYDAPWHAAWRGRKIRWSDEAAKALRVLGVLRRNRYDLAVDLRGDPRDIAFMAASGAAVKVGNGWRGGGFMLDVDADVDVEAHRVDFALGIARAAGAQVAPSAPQVCFGEVERQSAKSYLPDSERVRYIALHLGAGFPSKCLPIEKFAEVATTLVRYSGGEKRQIVIIGGKDDEPLAARFKSLAMVSPEDLVGKLNLLETAAVFERCALFVGNDSGPMHIAAAAGTPVVTFFGPSEPHKYGPCTTNHRLIERDLPCRPCDHIHCSQPEHICMTGIEVADIVSAAEELLSQGRR